MVLIECPSCRTWQGRKNKTCVKCGLVFRAKLTFVTRVGTPRGDGTYAYVSQRHPDLSYDEVKAIELQQKREIKAPPGSGALKLSGVFDLYIGYMRAKNPRWCAECERIAKETIDYFGDIPSDKLTRQMVLQYRNELTERPHQRRKGTISNRTINAYMQVGRAAYNHMDPGGKNPYAKLGRLPEKLVVEFLTEEEEERLLMVAKTRMPVVFQFICLSLATGFRKSECLNLKRSDCDFINKVITIRQKGNRLLAKPMTEMARLLLLSIPDDGSGYFFWNPQTQKPYADLKNGFKKCLSLAGIDKPFRQHGLRHHVAFKLLRTHRNLKLVQDFLGHSQIQTTTRYLAMLPDDIRDQAACLDFPNLSRMFDSDLTADNVVHLRK